MPRENSELICWLSVADDVNLVQLRLWEMVNSADRRLYLEQKGKMNLIKAVIDVVGGLDNMTDEIVQEYMGDEWDLKRLLWHFDPQYMINAFQIDVTPLMRRVFG
jgi:hypothetical protein